MFMLNPHNLHWLGPDFTKDQCAHGSIELVVDGKKIIAPEGEWNLTAAALNLLWTIEMDHTNSYGVPRAQHLVPCCGFDIYPGDDDDSFDIIECPSGIDISIEHREGQVYLSRDTIDASVSESVWSAAVLAFSDKIAEFYNVSLPKEPPDDEFVREGWSRFWNEFEAIRGRHSSA